MVIGGSIAGLCAARVLSDAFSRVTVYERDQLPGTSTNRATVPQDQHLHMLMARGAEEFESLFPGLLKDMAAAGVPMLENRPDCIHLGAAGHVLGVGHTSRDEFTAYVPSRPHLEWQLRQRVHDIDNVDIVRRSVTEPPGSTRARRRVTGVLLAPENESEPEFIAAGLVVDAAGRGTRLPVWLEQWGYRRPVEETIDIGIHYATQRFRIPEGLIAEKVVVAGASHDQSLGLGMLYYEDGAWVLTTFGVADADPPRTFPPRGHRAHPVVVAAVGRAVRPVPRRRRNRSRSRRMVSAPVLAPRQPLYDPAAADNRSRHAAQHAAVAARAPGGRPRAAGGHKPTVALNNFVGSRATRRIGPSSAATQAAIPRCSVSDPDLLCTVVQPSVHNNTCGPS